MFKYLNSIILKGESDDKKQKQSNINHTHSDKSTKSIEENERKRIDPWTQMIFPIYLDYKTAEDKLIKNGESKPAKSTKSAKSTEFPVYPPMDPLNKMDWKTFVPSNWPNINTEHKHQQNNDKTEFPIYPPMDPSKHMDWKKLIPHQANSHHQKTES